MFKILKFKKLRFIIWSLFFVPLLANADGVTDIIKASTKLVTNILIPIAFALCLFYFFWGIAKYLRTGAGSEKAAEEGRRIMLYGIIGIFVVFSVWGVIRFIQSEIGILPIDKVNIGDTD